MLLRHFYKITTVTFFTKFSSLNFLYVLLITSAKTNKTFCFKCPKHTCTIVPKITFKNGFIIFINIIMYCITQFLSTLYYLLLKCTSLNLLHKTVVDLYFYNTGIYITYYDYFFHMFIIKLRVERTFPPSVYMYIVTIKGLSIYHRK